VGVGEMDGGRRGEGGEEIEEGRGEKSGASGEVG